ncbi:MAG: antitoxin VapB family protein [Euryarchaeota archaeon]|nr:antitoxin VapB family protein [Euryarchaeota archaeon]MDE1835658.1 antitoxin VapB family protein [Euryarchaeota archaeon]MDE1879006.1 antitoxin VapB family protein [Euryarchaeota archaeon]MDE2043720.1 antitoxin VapB family protein [Thermoplasmata archaeon]
MTVKTVALSPETYARLRRHKRAGETFDDVVKRLTGKPRTIADFIGIWKDWPEGDFRKFERAIAEGRRRDRERTLRLLEGRE